MPSAIFSPIDSGISRYIYNTRDVLAFLTFHGLNIVVLILNLKVDPPVDVPTVLGICPAPYYLHVYHRPANGHN